jgi:hypothetical protein
MAIFQFAEKQSNWMEHALSYTVSLRLTCKSTFRAVSGNFVPDIYSVCENSQIYLQVAVQCKYRFTCTMTSLIRNLYNIINIAFMSNFVIHILYARYPMGRKDGVVVIATGYLLIDRGFGFRVPVESRNFFSPHRPDRLRAQPASCPIGTGGTLSPGVKRAERQAEHSPPDIAEVKKVWIYTSITPYSFMA